MDLLIRYYKPANNVIYELACEVAREMDLRFATSVGGIMGLPGVYEMRLLPFDDKECSVVGGERGLSALGRAKLRIMEGAGDKVMGIYIRPDKE